jgi:hypothetical protein
MSSPKEDLLTLKGVGGSGLFSSGGGVHLTNSWKGMIVCSNPLEAVLAVSVEVKGSRFIVGGIVCSIPCSEGVDDLAVRICGRLRGTLGTGSCGRRGRAQPAVSP